VRERRPHIPTCALVPERACSTGRIARMKIEYFHASVYGNGMKVAEEFADQMAARGVTVAVHHIKDVRFGKPPRDMRRFLKKVRLPAGTRYAILATGLAPQPDKAGQMPTDEELGRCERVVPVMNEMLQGKGLVEVAEDKVLVTGIKGPLEGGWQVKVSAFAARIPSQP
jgi:hypothetical protein